MLASPTKHFFLYHVCMCQTEYDEVECTWKSSILNWHQSMPACVFHKQWTKKHQAAWSKEDDPVTMMFYMLPQVQWNLLHLPTGFHRSLLHRVRKNESEGMQSIVDLLPNWKFTDTSN